MRSLPLYEAPPRLAIQDAAPLDVDPGCARCSLHDGVRNRCLGADGEPGGLLVVGESPGKIEDAQGRVFVGQSGLAVRPFVDKRWSGPVVYANAIGCAPGSREITEKHLDACRPYLTQTIAEAAPKRIVVLGAHAALSITGRSISTLAQRRAYTYLIDGERRVPVFFVMHPTAALRNRFFKRQFEEDLAWALTCPDPDPPPLGGVVRVVETEADAREAIRQAFAGSWASIDVETAGRMHEPNFRLLCLSICAEGSDDAWVWDGSALARPETRRTLVEALLDASKGKVGQNFKYDLSSLEIALFGGASKRMVRGTRFDVRLRRKLIDPEADGKLEKMAELVGMGGMKEEAQHFIATASARVTKALSAEAKLVRLSMPAGCSEGGKKPRGLSAAESEALAWWRGVEQEDSELARYVRFARENEIRNESWAYAFVPEEALVRYNARDTVATSRLGVTFEKAIEAEPQLARTERLLVTRAAHAVRRIEQWGIAADRTAIETFDAYCAVEIARAWAKLTPYGEFNPASTQQVSKFLFETLKLKPGKKTDGGAWSTDDTVLEELADKHPAARGLLEFRKFSKLRSAYAGGLLAYIQGDGRIHGSILLDGARSGRASMTDPALQTIPSEKRDPVLGKMARDCFVAERGKYLLQLDYAQIELRVAAMISGDEVMLQDFLDGADPHMRTAKYISKVAWGISPDAVTKEHRSKSKAVTFGVLYGKTDGGLARDLRCTKSEAAKIREAIFGRFKKLSAWIDQNQIEARKTGEVWTMWAGQRARRRPLPRIGDHDDKARSNAENAATNSPIQGWASDFLLASIGEGVEWIEREGIERDVKLILPVHDSLLFEVSEDMLAETASVVREIMLGHDSCGVPLAVDVEVGRSWGTMSEYKAAA